MADDDDYGRRRNADFEYALAGGKPVEREREPNKIEKLLIDANMPKREVEETAKVILMAIEKMGVKAPPPEQEKTVGMLIGPVANGELVRNVTNLAVEQVRMKQAFGTPQNTGGSKSTFTPPTHRR